MQDYNAQAIATADQFVIAAEVTNRGNDALAYAPRTRKNYARRAAVIEPVFAQIKHNRSINTISRRGLTAADSEWKLICGTHNLLKVDRTA
ncbi:transposase [Nocardioides albidus]|uniref:transposase n=1 Tax=Nocardioides albidus TaxID=1517589 RepID=UPI001305171E|nr:transposase [Nocardioides albidus]